MVSSIGSSRAVIGIAAVAALTVCTLLFLRSRNKSQTEPSSTPPLNQGRTSSFWISIPGIGRLWASFFSSKPTPQVRELGSAKTPIKSEEELKIITESVARTPPKSLDALIIHGDGNLEIYKDPGILQFNLKKLILNGASIVQHGELDGALVNNGWYNEYKTVIVTVVASVEEALNAKLPDFEGIPIPTIYRVKA